MADKDSKSPESASPRKGRPRDLAEVHKPSRKVALNEVLRSLQDLVNNELASDAEPAKSGSEAKPVNHSRSADRKKSPIVTEDKPSKPDRESPPVPPEGLQQELPLLQTADSAMPEVKELSPDTAGASSGSPASIQDSADESIELTIPDEPSVPKGPERVATSVPETDAVSPGDLIVDDNEPIDLAIDSLPGTPDPDPTASPASEATDHASDIPVLEDVIDLHDEPSALTGHTPVTTDPRKLAIQVAARLNVELRKAGKPVLGSEVITRLARLLGEALAKPGENTENSPPEKH